MTTIKELKDVERYQVQLHDVYGMTEDEIFCTIQEAKEHLEMIITDKYKAYDYAGGSAIIYDKEMNEIVYEQAIVESHSASEKHSCMTDAEAYELAKELIPEGGYIEASSADCDNLPCPGLDSWSGCVSAYRVYDVWGDEVAIIGYWD